jgi:tRNA (guanosine-2'-O-)-methyltransferase
LVPFFILRIMMEEKLLAAFYDIISESKVEMFDRIAADRTNYVTVVLENIFQEHNASAILRSCDCFGIQNLHVIEKDNQYKIQRDIALGAGRWVDVFNYDQGENPTVDCINKLKEKGYKIVATTPHEKDCVISDLDLSQPIALVFGTERRGISEDVQKLADAYVKIPMYGFTESFNVSVSAAITLNVIRERLEKSIFNWKLSEEEQIKLKIKWSKKIVNKGDLLEKEFIRRIMLD